MYLFIYLSICSFIYLSFFQFIYLSISLYIYTYPFIYLSIFHFINPLCIYLFSISISIYFSCFNVCVWERLFFSPGIYGPQAIRKKMLNFHTFLNELFCPLPPFLGLLYFILRQKYSFTRLKALFQTEFLSKNIYFLFLCK